MNNDLSPTAQAVIDHFLANVEISLDHGVAAALRAATDRVVPEEPLHGGDQRWMYERDARQDCRKRLLAIAAELEGPNE